MTRDVNAIGLLEPSAIRCDSSAPLPYGDVSQLNISGRPIVVMPSTHADEIIPNARKYLTVVVDTAGRLVLTFFRNLCLIINHKPEVAP